LYSNRRTCHRERGVKTGVAYLSSRPDRVFS
jgi:hypothetical protein